MSNKSKVAHQKKIAILQKIRDEREILFGAFSNKLSKEDKTKKWQAVTDLAHSLGIAQGKPWTYIRDTVWGNWRKRTMEKRDNAVNTGRGGGTKAKLTEIDHLVLDIAGKDNPGVVGLGQSDSFGNGDETSNLNGENSNSSPSPAAVEEANEVNLDNPTQRCASPEQANASDDNTTNGMAGKRASPPLTLRQIKKAAEEAKKKKIDLQNEALQLQNYKMRLEILQLEKTLNLPRSQYTSSILEYEWLSTNQRTGDEDGPPTYINL